MSTPSTTRTQFRSYMTPLIEGRSPITATTDSAGTTTTAIASSLIEYYDDFGKGSFFNGWWLYDADNEVERRIKEFSPENGVLSVFFAFSSSVGTDTSIEVHPFPVADYNTVINQALSDVYNDGHYFNPEYNETLWGQESYGEEPDEFNKSTYSVPTAFQEFPTIYIRESYTGEHTGSDGASALTSTDLDLETDELVGETVHNKTDGSSGTVTSNTSNTVTASLSDSGTWDEGDEFIVPRPSARPQKFYDYTRTGFAQGGALEFFARIPEYYVIILEGKGPLTTFSSDSDTTELYESDARVVAMYATYKFCDMMSQRYGGERDEWNQRAQEWWTKFQNQVHGGLEEATSLRIDRSWL